MSQPEQNKVAPPAPTTKWAEEVRDVQVALCPPAVRMVFVSAWSDGAESGHQLDQVVALQSVIRRCYARRYTGHRPSSDGTERDLVRQGWQLCSQVAMDHALILDNGGALSTCEDSLVGFINTVGELACCPWPPEEDEDRLKDVIAGLKTKAGQKARRSEAE
jgi:hypothetical protein